MNFFSSRSLVGSAPRFRENALALAAQLAGDTDKAREALNKAADEDDRKARRLRDLAATLPKGN